MPSRAIWPARACSARFRRVTAVHVPRGWTWPILRRGARPRACRKRWRLSASHGSARISVARSAHPRRRILRMSICWQARGGAANGKPADSPGCGFRTGWSPRPVSSRARSLWTRGGAILVEHRGPCRGGREKIRASAPRHRPSALGPSLRRVRLIARLALACASKQRACRQHDCASDPAFVMVGGRIPEPHFALAGSRTRSPKTRPRTRPPFMRCRGRPESAPRPASCAEGDGRHWPLSHHSHRARS